MFRFIRYFCVVNNANTHCDYYEIEATFGKFSFKELDNSAQIHNDCETINWNDFRALCVRVAEIVEIKLPNERTSNEEVITLFMELIDILKIAMNV